MKTTVLTENNRELLVKVVSLLMILNNRIRKRSLFVAATVRKARKGWNASENAYVFVFIMVCVCEVWGVVERREQEEIEEDGEWNLKESE